MNDQTLEEMMAELEGAEDFLEFFGIDYDPAVVHVNRLHILQRFHDYLEEAVAPGDETAVFIHRAHLLDRAYRDFVASDALTEKVFKVFHRNEPQIAFVPLERIGRGT